MNIKYELLASRYDSSEAIRGLGNAWVFTHSESSALGCPRLWTYSYMEAYKGGKRSPTLMYGSIWHMMCEWFLLNVKENEDCFKDPEHCRDKVDQHFGSWCDREFKDLTGEHYTSYDLDDMHDEFKGRLLNALEGWRRHVYEKILPTYEVLEVEMEVYAPILKDNGKPFKPRQHVVCYDMGDGNHVYRPAFTHENSGQKFRGLLKSEQIEYNGKKSLSSEIKIVYWKWFKVGKIDGLLRKKGTNQLWVLDHKTTTSIGSYESKMSLDTQLEGYAYLLRHVIDNDERYKGYKDFEICGLLWDLCHSKVPKQPEPLMSGKLSVAKKSVPSWQYENAVNKLVEEDETIPLEDIQKYKEHIEYCRENFDNKYFRLCENYMSEANFYRIEAENYAIAKKIATLRRTLCNVDYKNEKKFAEVAYRYPLCSRHGNCSFASMCVADNTPSVILNKQIPKLIWTKQVTN